MNQALCVIGMHRSGTSLVAGILKSVGIYLGKESRLLPASADNLKGYWEHITFLEINEGILRTLGGSWQYPPRLRATWLDSPTARQLAERAARYISVEFADRGLWAWKEPRTTLMIPFWNLVVPDAKYVLCVRNPLDVASSLRARDGITMEHALILWHIYTLTALRDTEANSRFIAAYERILADPTHALPSLFDFAGMADSPTSEQWRTVELYIDANLSHGQHSLQNTIDHPQLPRDVKQLYIALMTDDEATIHAAVCKSEATLTRLYTSLRVARLKRRISRIPSYVQALAMSPPMIKTVRSEHVGK